MLGLYALLARLVMEVGNAIVPLSTADFGDDPIAVSWLVVAVSVFTVGYLFFWYSSAQLFAQFAIAIGIGDGFRSSEKEKGKVDFTVE